MEKKHRLDHQKAHVYSEICHVLNGSFKKDKNSEFQFSPGKTQVVGKIQDRAHGT